MLLYDVTYPHSRDLDKAVSWRYLEKLAADRRHDGAEARCINGEAAVYVLRSGEWTEKQRRE
jgi:hypothetical protein